jgi:PPK2 family polyphosphate:nucleotide phosphotransferase
MVSEEVAVQFKKLLVKPGKKFKLSDCDTAYNGEAITKEEAAQLLESGLGHLAEIQDKLYAHNRYSVLIILQAMDAAGKDSAIKHMLSGLNPTGVRVYSFKTPSSIELDHYYLWRHNLALPSRGEIAIHNRSHYENVLITKVHPEYILNENLPGIQSIKDIDKHFWKKRYKQIRRFEKNLYENGTIILKFFLHVSKKEQKKRFIERIEDSTKNWKFSLGDLKERAHWDEYQKAYEDALEATSQEHAPWFVIPADDKWYARLAMVSILYKQFQALSLEYPSVSEAQKAELEKAKAQLLAEKEKNVTAKKKSQ